MDFAATADTIVLIAGPGPGPELVAALLVLAVLMVGTVVAVMMARRGRVEAWSLAGLFALTTFGVLLLLTHLPTRLVLDRNGVELAFWELRDRRGWSEIAAVDVRRVWFGTLVSFTPRKPDPSMLSLWSRWPGLYVPSFQVEPRQIAMRVDAWRLTAGR